jgi:hypothetical protein
MTPQPDTAQPFGAVAAKMAMPPLPDFEPLPFVRHVLPNRRDHGAFDFWHVEPTGDSTADFQRGAEYHRAAAATARRIGRPDLLACIVAPIVLKGRMGSIEAGFFYRLITLSFKAALH